MENENKATKHWVITIGAFVIALAFRLIRLGVLTLTNQEAQYALQALAVARGEQTVFSGYHTYVGLTGLPFYLFSESNFMARFWPAFVGALIVFIPPMFSNRIGKWPALFTSFVLAISPEMVGLSRIVGSPIMAFVFILLAIGFWFNRKFIPAGIFLGLGLMSGMSFWVGVLILGITLLISKRLLGFQLTFIQEMENGLTPTMWTKFAISLTLALVVIGSGMFMAPSGLSGIFSGLFTFINGFWQARLIPWGWALLALLVYGTGAVVFGLWGAIRGILIRNKVDAVLSLWAGIALVFIFLFSGGTTGEIVWVTFPLWILAARVVFLAWQKPESSKLVVVITTVIIIVIAAFNALALRAFVAPGLSKSEQMNTLIALAASIIMMIAIILLINYGWSEDLARSSLLLGIGLVLLVSMISVSVNSTGLGSIEPLELWYPDEGVFLSEWIQVTIDRVMVWNSRSIKPVDIIVSGMDSPGLRWALRSYDQVVFEPFVPLQSSPGVLITPIGEIPENLNSYQGQSLVWEKKVSWNELNFKDYLAWTMTRKAHTSSQELILWVRTDLMPGGQLID